MTIEFPDNPDVRRIARRVVWFEEPEKALSDPVRFLAYACRYATVEDMQTIRKHVDDDAFRYALDHAPPGIIDPRSWSYWNVMLGRYPPPPMPGRAAFASAERQV